MVEESARGDQQVVFNTCRAIHHLPRRPRLLIAVACLVNVLVLVASGLVGSDRVLGGTEYAFLLMWIGAGIGIWSPHARLSAFTLLIGGLMGLLLSAYAVVMHPMYVMEWDCVVGLLADAILVMGANYLLRTEGSGPLRRHPLLIWSVALLGVVMAIVADRLEFSLSVPSIWTAATLLGVVGGMIAFAYRLNNGSARRV